MFFSSLKPWRWVASLLVVPSLAWAFTLITADMRGWDPAEVKLHFNPANCPSGAAVEEAIERSVNLWNGAPTSRLRLVYQGKTSLTGGQGEPVVECVTSGLASSLGVGILSTIGGRINSAHIELNGEPSAVGYVGNYTVDQLAVVVAHEIGHVIGLGHSSSETALMYPSIGRKDTLSLSQDEVDGVTYLYPRREPADGALGCASLGAGLGGGGNGDGSGGGLLPWLAIVMLATLWLRGRASARSSAV